MTKFRKLDPDTVHIGRGASAAEARALYVEALRDADAGRVELDEGEEPALAKRRLREAAKLLGIKVRSSWTDSSETVLIWKRTGL